MLLKKYILILVILIIYNNLVIQSAFAEKNSCIFIEWTWAGSYKLCWFKCGDKKIPKPINSADNCEKLISKMSKNSNN